MEKKKILIGMIVINIISLVLGFLRDSSIAYSLGATNISDIFIFITNLPTVLFSAIGWVIMSTFVPVYTDVMLNDSKENMNKFANTFIKLIGATSIIIMIFLYLFNNIAISVLAPGFKSDNFELTRKLFFIVLPSFALLTISSCLSAILNSYKKMLWVSSIGIPVNVMIIIGILFVYPCLGIEAAVAMMIIASLIQIVILVIPLKNTDFKFSLDFDLGNRNIKKIMRMIGPMFIGVMAQQINMMFGGAITSTLNSGSLTAYNLANKVTNAAYNSIILIGISFIFPYLSESFSRGKVKEYLNQIKKSIDLIFIILIPIGILLIVLSSEIVSILYGYGKFSAEDIALTGNILIFLSIGIVGLGIKELINRAFYAANDTKTPMIYSVIGIIINIVLSLSLVKSIGVLGVAIGSTISTVVSSILIVISFQRNSNMKSLINKKMIFKYLAVTILLFFISKFIRTKIYLICDVKILIAVIVSIITMLVYLMLLRLFNINIIKYFRETLGKE